MDRWAHGRKGRGGNVPLGGSVRKTQKTTKELERRKRRMTGVRKKCCKNQSSRKRMRKRKMGKECQVTVGCQSEIHRKPREIQTNFPERDKRTIIM